MKFRLPGSDKGEETLAEARKSFYLVYRSICFRTEYSLCQSKKLHPEPRIVWLRERIVAFVAERG